MTQQDKDREAFERWFKNERLKFMPLNGINGEIISYHAWQAARDHYAPMQDVVPVADMDVEIAIAEAIQLMPRNTSYEEKGVPVLAYLKQHGYFVMQRKSDADAIAEALKSMGIAPT